MVRSTHSVRRRTRLSAAVLAGTLLSTAAVTVAFAGPASATTTAHRPAVTRLTLSKHALPATGGKVVVTAKTSGARLCALSVRPAVKGASDSIVRCSLARRTLTIPRDATTKAREYQVTITAWPAASRLTAALHAVGLASSDAPVHRTVVVREAGLVTTKAAVGGTTAASPSTASAGTSTISVARTESGSLVGTTGTAGGASTTGGDTSTAPSGTAPTISGPGTVTCITTQPCSATLDVAGSPAPNASVSTPDGADGLSATVTGGSVDISGTPASPGEFEFDVAASNSVSSSSGSVDISVLTEPSFTSATSADFTVGTTGSFSITAKGSTNSTPMTESGTLPDGLTFTADGSVAATVSGNPTEAGTFPVTLTVTDELGNTVTQDVQLVVAPTPSTIQVTGSSSVAAGANGYVSASVFGGTPGNGPILTDGTATFTDADGYVTGCTDMAATGAGGWLCDFTVPSTATAGADVVTVSWSGDDEYPASSATFDVSITG